MSFEAPIVDIALALEVAGHSTLKADYFPDLDDETVTAILKGAGSYANDVLAPINRGGDLHGAKLENGGVVTAKGFADAYRTFVEQGWSGLSAGSNYGGQGLTKALHLAVFEMMHAANMAFGLCPLLSQGAIDALSLHGTPRQKAHVLPKLVSGEWTGTMNLTEPQAGSDLAAIRTRAEPDGEGAYKLFGEKIFITWGDHDVAENICHLVLARTPGALPGNKGVSLFLATKRIVEADGGLGRINDLRAGRLEHKLGIHGSPTCEMLFEGAHAELVGDLGQGVAHMFVMMNAARLQVGVQGVAIAERAFQQALAYSQTRQQGRAAWSADGMIYGHPDVRRTLLLSKAKIEAARGICLTVAVLADVETSAASEQAREAAKDRRELLTPIAKAWSSDIGVEVASMAVQVHGGMGYIEETGAAQHYRDARIAPIYEGTNGIQAVDLVTRKVPLGQGQALWNLCADMFKTADDIWARPEFGALDRRFSVAIKSLEQATQWMLAHPGAPALAAATPYLRLFGDVVGGWFLIQQALLARGRAEEVAASKLALARLFGSQVLSLAQGLADAISDGDDNLRPERSDEAVMLKATIQA